LNPGTRLGPYEITAKLGEGGMGEVWRATDSRLKREVAIKVLPAAFTADPERLARFEREAQLLAQLQHPHIAAIFGLEESDAERALVMELVDGPTLAERLAAGPLPVVEALQIASQIADALAQAHRKGIVHRDLKPQNVKLTADGQVKILDFGLAKALDPAPSTAPPADWAQSPTLSGAATRLGTLLGTAAYMAPEQAHGRPVDRRADVWAFGAVLYEMLAGRPLFRGVSATDTLAAVLRDPIDWAALPATLPATVQELLARCLERDPARRLAEIGEARHALAEAGAGTRGAAPVRPHRRAPWLAVAGVALVAVATALLWQRARGSADRPATSAEPGRSIAVLPFVNSSGDAADEYLADGITDELIAGLGKVPGLHVAARSSAFAFKGQRTEARAVASRLGVETVLEGTVRRSGRRLRVTASLVNAADGLQLWSTSFENEGGDAFAVQDEVTRGVVSGLSLQLRGAALAASQAGRTKNPQALDLYLRGLQSANAGSEADLRRALDYYQQALALDPDFALAYTGIAWVHAFLADAYVAPSEAYPKARAAAQAAIDRDPRVADAHALLAYAIAALEWGNWAPADAEFGRALELDPNSANAIFLLAAYRCINRRSPAEAFADIDRAERLDPLSPLPPTLREICYYGAGRYEAVIEAHRKTAAIDPSFVYIQSWAGAAYRELGDHPAALREYAAAGAALGDAPQYGLGLTYVRMGRHDEAREVLRRLDERARMHYVPYYMRAVLHAALGDRDEAAALMQQAIDHREGLMMQAVSLPEAAPLAADPRGRRIFDKIEALWRPATP
jgi:serine/threonine-protein kinase